MSDMSYCIRDILNFLRLCRFRGVEGVSGRTSSELVKQECADLFLKCDSACPSTLASNCVGRKPINAISFSMSHLLYVTERLRRTAWTGYVRMEMFLSNIWNLSDSIYTKLTEKNVLF